MSFAVESDHSYWPKSWSSPRSSLGSGPDSGPGSGPGSGPLCGCGSGVPSLARSRRVWRLVPHLVLVLSLVLYAALGAAVFWVIEGGDGANSTDPQYKNFLRDLVQTVQNRSENGSYSMENVTKEVRSKMDKDFQSIWLQNPTRWNYASSMFFCCTVFTTVGYGELYPVTLPGKVACVLYAMVGVPLMLLVILDVGDFLALLMTQAYKRVHRLVRALRRRRWTRFSPWKMHRKSFDLQMHRTLEDGTIEPKALVMSGPLDIRQVLHSQQSVRQRSVQLQNNREIFERILARERLLRKGPLSRSMSCPELDRLPRSKKPFVLWDYGDLGNEMDRLDVPFLLILFVVFAYVLLLGLVLPLWETELRGFDAFYFCFITVTTIGFGDIVPKHPNYFMLTSFFVISGMAIVSMAFKLSQSRIVGVYRRCIRYVNPRKDQRCSLHGN